MCFDAYSMAVVDVINIDFICSAHEVIDFVEFEIREGRLGAEIIDVDIKIQRIKICCYRVGADDPREKVVSFCQNCQRQSQDNKGF